MLFGGFAESQSKDFKDLIDQQEYAENYGYLSDSDLEDDWDEQTPNQPQANPDSHPPDPPAASGEDKISHEEYEERVEKGKVVKIPDVAFVT